MTTSLNSPFGLIPSSARSRKLSISELSGHCASLRAEDAPCRASLTIMRAPQPKDSTANTPSSPLLSPRGMSQLGNKPFGPSLMLPFSASERNAETTMPRTPTDFYSPDQVLEAVYNSSQISESPIGLMASSHSDDMAGSPQLCPDDILLPRVLETSAL
jgi:hypothetical protein